VHAPTPTPQIPVIRNPNPQIQGPSPKAQALSPNPHAPRPSPYAPRRTLSLVDEEGVLAEALESMERFRKSSAERWLCTLAP